MHRATLFVLWFALSPILHAETITVATQPLGELTVQLQHDAPAEVISLREAKIGTEAAGRVTSVNVQVGDFVQTGQTIASLDCRDAESQVRQLQAVKRALAADLRLARVQLKRTRKLITQGNASEELVDQRTAEVERIRAQIDQRDAELDQARTAITRCSVKAPFDGVIIARHTHEGEVAAVGTTTVTLLDTLGVELRAEIPLSRVPGFQTAMARDQAHSFKELGHEQTVRCRFLPQIDPTARSREARCKFPAEPPLPGTPGRLTWTDARPHVPSWLPVNREGRVGLFLAQDGKARFHHLIGASEGRPAPVRLDPNTQVITEGRHALRDGQAIKIQTLTQ